MSDVIIKNSEIHGKGLFAGRDFKKGEIVLKWNPKVLNQKEVDALLEDPKSYVFKIAEDKFYLMQEPEKYMNHSCENNTRVIDDCDVAVRDIKEGEELTANYNDDGGVLFDCICGTKSCRGKVK